MLPRGLTTSLPMPNTASCRQVRRSPTQARAIGEARGVRRGLMTQDTITTRPVTAISPTAARLSPAGAATVVVLLAAL